MTRVFASGITIVALALAAQALPAHPASAATAAVSVEDNMYVPNSITITAGDTVQWTWAGVNQHTVSSTSAEAFDSGAPQSTGSFSHTFNAAGTFTYECGVHGAAMQGTVVVQAAAAATNTPAAATNTPAAATNTPSAATHTPGAATSTNVPADTATPAGTAATRTPGALLATPTRAAGGAVLPATGDGTTAGSMMSWQWMALSVVAFGVACATAAGVLHRVLHRM
jgi:plastocyanin